MRLRGHKGGKIWFKPQNLGFVAQIHTPSCTLGTPNVLEPASIITKCHYGPFFKTYPTQGLKCNNYTYLGLKLKTPNHRNFIVHPHLN